MEQQTDESVRGELTKIIGEKLHGMGINYHDITININTNGQSGQEIESVDITLDMAHEKDHGEIRETLVRDLGLTIRLGYERGGGESENG